MDGRVKPGHDHRIRIDTFDMPPRSRGAGAPESSQNLAPSSNRGRAGMPGAERTRSLAWKNKNHTS